MSVHPLPNPPPGFDELSVEEQVEYVEDLWNRIAGEPDKLPVPDWHHQVIEERLADLASGPNEGRPWEQVKQDLLRSTSGK